MLSGGRAGGRGYALLLSWERAAALRSRRGCSAGLIPIGDAICRFNPIFGQGMSVAAQEAVMLNRLLDEQAEDQLNGLAQRYFAAIQGAIETPWGVAISDFVYPSTRGQRPPDFSQRMQYSI